MWALALGALGVLVLVGGLRWATDGADRAATDGGGRGPASWGPELRFDVPGIVDAHKPRTLVRLFTTVDHKDIGLLYLVLGTVAAIWGGTDAMMMRAELLTPAATVWDVGTYNELFTTHGLTMLFFFVTPVFAGIGNYFLPLLLGADDMAFPRINAIAFWLLPPSLAMVRAGLLVEVAGRVFGALGVTLRAFEVIAPPNTGWTMYVPLSAQVPNPQVSVMLLGLHLSGLATTMAAINFIVTIFAERGEGVTWATLDIFSWSMLATSALILFAFPLLGSTLVMLLLDRVFGTTFFAFGPSGIILFQHLFWFFGHPEVYILVLPAFGLVSLILPKFSGRRLFGFRFIVYSTLAIAVLSFGVWAHHMFATGIDPRIRASFMAVSLAIAVPSAVKVFNWITTMYNGRVRLTAPMLFCVGSVALFIVGGITGVFLAAIPIDLVYHGTYYVVGHFHLIIMGVIPFSMLAASHYWFPLLTGKMYDRTLARVSAVMLTVGSGVTFSTLVIIGMFGVPRRWGTYFSEEQVGPTGEIVVSQGFQSLIQNLHVVASVGAFVIFLGVNVWLYNMVQSARVGDPIEDPDPWDLKETGQFTREWQWFEDERFEE